mmetsp:Transcript_21022/g.39509  ORF Transcript_21022/g.39509 Transcript_21022/m.39509 type:complete len:128 (-) Transcript_21022:203-586(-)
MAWNQKERPSRKDADEVKLQQRRTRFQLGMEHQLASMIKELQHQEQMLVRERDERYARKRRRFQPDNPVTPDLRPLLALDPLAHLAPMSPLHLDGADSEAESAWSHDAPCSKRMKTSSAKASTVEID